MIEISTDPDGTVYVRWHGGGPFRTLDEDGTVGESVLGGLQDWTEYDEDDDEDGWTIAPAVKAVAG